jgi:hypothetical protein
MSVFMKIVSKQSQKNHFLTMLYAIFLQNGLSMDISTASSSGSRASFNETNFKRKYNNVFKGNGYYSPRKRLKINNHVLDDLTAKTKAAFERSYLFKPGKQKQDDHFNQTFCGVYGAYRGGENLVDKVSFDLAKSLPSYGDISETTYHIDDTLDTNVEVTKHLPTECLIKELQDILEAKYGLQQELLEAFQSNGKKLNEDLKLQDRDTWITEFTHHVKESAEEPFDRGISAPLYCIPFQALATAFPRTVETLQEILENVLKSEWLKEDIAGVKTYLNENNYIDHPIQIEDIQKAIILWEQAKYQAEKEKLKDKKHWEKVKDDMLGVAISGGLSFTTGNPSFIIGKLSQFTVNRIADQSDPHGEDKGIQALKSLAGAGLGGAMGGNPWDLGTALGVDLLDISTEDPNEERSAIRGLGSSILKGVLTEDKKKLITHFLCGATAEVARKLPENDENTPLDVRIARALLSNSDVHSYYVKLWVDQRFKAPEEQAKFPKQQPTDLDLKIKKAHDELIQKEAGVENAFIYLDDKQDDYDRNYHKDKYHKKLKSGIKNYNNALAERDVAFNKLAELYGSTERATTKPIKIPKQAGNWEKAKLWINRNVAASGEMSIGSIPLYETKTPQSSDRSIPQYQDQERSKPTLDTPQNPTTQYSANMGQWEGIQEQQTQQIFAMNMAYRTPSVEPQLALMQQPRQNSPKLEPRVLQAGFIPMEPYPMWSHLMEIRPEVLEKMVNNDFLKNVPKGVGKVVKGIFSMMMVDMSDRPGAADPKKEFKNLCHNLGKLYDEKVQIQDPNSFASKAGRFTGEMLALGAAGKVIRVAEGVSLFATASEGGLYGAIIAEAHDTNKFAGVAFGFAGGGVGHCVGGVFSKIAKPTPLTDRALMPNAVYHSGFHPMGEMFVVNKSLPAKTLEQLKNRSVGQIRTDWVFPQKGGATINGRWYTEHALERMAPRTPEVMAELESRFVERAKVLEKTLPPKRFLKWYRENYPNPRGIPPSVIEAEIARPGSTSVRVEINQKGDVITAIPGGKK